MARHLWSQPTSCASPPHLANTDWDKIGETKVELGDLGMKIVNNKVKWMTKLYYCHYVTGRGWVFLSLLFRWNFFVDHSRHYQLETLLVLVSNTNFLCRKSVVIIDIFMSLSVLAFCQSLFTSKCPDLDHKIWNWHARILVLEFWI